MDDINNGICLSLTQYDNLQVHHVAAYGIICSVLWLSIGEGNGNPLQYFCLENPTDRGAWHAAVLGVAKSQT